MSAVLLALFKDYETAERVLVDLVNDGFPCDRVDLTSRDEPGRAACEPSDTLHGKLAQYFGTLFNLDEERESARRFAECVENGAAAVTVHPRGPVEIERAAEILKRAGAQEVAQHDLACNTWEHAAARSASPWVSNFWVESTGEAAHCIYCRLFPGTEHSH